MQQVRSKQKVNRIQLQKKDHKQISIQDIEQSYMKTIIKKPKNHQVNQQMNHINTFSRVGPPMNSHSKKLADIKIYKPELKLKIISSASQTKNSIKKSRKQKIKYMYILLSKLQLIKKRNEEKIIHISERIKHREAINQLSIQLLQTLKKDQELISIFQNKYQQNIENRKILETMLANRKQIIQKHAQIQGEMQSISNNIQSLKQRILKNRQQIRAYELKIEKQISLNNNLNTKLNQIGQKNMDILSSKLSQSLFHALILQIQKFGLKKKKSTEGIEMQSPWCLQTPGYHLLNKIPLQILQVLTAYLLLQYQKHSLTFKSQNFKFMNKLSYFSNKIANIFNYEAFSQIYRALYSSGQYSVANNIQKLQQIVQDYDQSMKLGKKIIFIICKQCAQKQNSSKLSSINIFQQIPDKCMIKITNSV